MPPPQRVSIPVPHGGIEAVIELPRDTPTGLALVAHPHPLRGGSLDNKVAFILAKAALARGMVAARPNFRGVGASDGLFDHGVGETDDMLAVARYLTDCYGDLPWTLMGFSFGAYVQQRLARRLPARRLILVGPAVSLYPFDPPAVPTAILHGEDDEVIPLAAVREYARRHAIPLQVMPGAGHFFHGRLRELQDRVESLCETLQ